VAASPFGTVFTERASDGDPEQSGSPVFVEQPTAGPTNSTATERTTVLRFIVFPERPEALLVLATEANEPPFTLPALAPPFSRAVVANALRGADIPVRITEEAPGRWGFAIDRAKREASAERAQREKERVAAEVAVGRNSADANARSRSDLLAEKLRVDEEIAALKKRLGSARSNAFTSGTYMPPDEYRRLEARLESLKLRSQAIQVELREVRLREKAANVAAHLAEHQTWCGKFVDAARKMLDGETFKAIVEAVGEAADEEPEDAR
jgi:hypothetical protein